MGNTPPFNNAHLGGQMPPGNEENRNSSESKFTISLTFFVFLIMGIIGMVGFIFNKYYQLERSIDRNTMHLEKIEEIGAIRKEHPPSLIPRNYTLSSAPVYSSKSFIGSEQDCEELKSEIARLESNLKKMLCPQ